MKNLIVFALGAFFISVAGSARGENDAAEPERRAISFLAREIGAWPAENKCFSCHNNGDAARAAYGALKLGCDLQQDRLRSTTDWLSRPENWRLTKVPAEFRDDRLSAIQFAGALTSAVEADCITDRETLISAAELVAAEQDDDGSWHVDQSGQAGSPVTYGTGMASWLARRTLMAASEQRYREAIGKADAWFRTHEARNTPDAAGALLALADARDAAAIERRKQCLDTLRLARTDEGGWGPYPKSPVEVFDTALAILALAAQPRTAETEVLLDAGRKFLLAEQLDDGSWVETTRPSGSRSYAQRMSTTAWATLTLLATRK